MATICTDSSGLSKRSQRSQTTILRTDRNGAQTVANLSAENFSVVFPLRQHKSRANCIPIGHIVQLSDLCERVTSGRSQPHFENGSSARERCSKYVKSPP